MSSRPLPSYYYSQRPSSDSGLSSDDVSTGTSDDESFHLYENVQFPRRSSDKSIRDNCVTLHQPPPPPLKFRDEHHPDGIDHKENNIELADCISGLTCCSNDGDDFVLEDIGPNMTLPNPEDNVETAPNNKSERRQVPKQKDERVILSKLGTVRGIKHRVTIVKQNLLQSLGPECQLDKQTLREEERDRCIIYVTSLGVVRGTIQRCWNIRKILRNLCVRVLEKDVYLSREYRTEIATRLKESYSDLTLPLVFINGQLLGDAEVVERMNESGELRSVLGPYRDLSGVSAVCRRCGDYRMFPCPACSGSKVGHSVWHGAVRLRCTQCEETGLVKCQLCSNNTGHHSNE